MREVLKGSVVVASHVQSKVKCACRDDAISLVLLELIGQLVSQKPL